jgi:hypothetical protein
MSSAREQIEVQPLAQRKTPASSGLTGATSS